MSPSPDQPANACKSEPLQVAQGCEPLVSALGFTCLADVFACTRGQRLDKPGLENWRQRWRICLEQGGGPARTVYLKRFDRPPLRRQLERWRSGVLKLSTAGVEWRNATDLARAGIRAAGPVAFGQKMTGPLERRSCIVLGEAPGESLEKWVPKNLARTADEKDFAARRRLLDGLARYVARFHASGFVHRDLYLCHIFFDADVASAARDVAGVEEAFCLIDLQRVFRPYWRRRRWVVKDLAALDFSTPADRVSGKERLRFLCRYVKCCQRFGSARLLARRIAARRERMTRRLRATR